MSVPELLIEMLDNQYGKEITSEILEGYNVKRKITFRVNTIKSNTNEIEKVLNENNIEYSHPSWYRDAFIIENVREDIIKKCVFCKIEDNGIEHVTNNYIKFKKVREELIDKRNKLDANTKNKTLLEIIEYYYYSKKLFETKMRKRMIIMELD